MKSGHIRVVDSRAIFSLVGECRELGHDAGVWRRHGVERLARLVDADLGFLGEMSRCLELIPTSLGVADWGWENGFDRDVYAERSSALQDDPNYSPALIDYFRRLAADDGVCCSRPDLMTDREWDASVDYQDIHRPFGVDEILWCFRSIRGGAGDEFNGLILLRAAGRRRFGARERLIIREALAALTPMVGGPLARYADPSPLSLARRPLQVLACLLEGDCDKQIAARLNLSKFTVNQYIKIVFRHFGVASRPELLARWIRRGWGEQVLWPARSETASRPRDETPPA